MARRIETAALLLLLLTPTHGKASGPEPEANEDDRRNLCPAGAQHAAQKIFFATDFSLTADGVEFPDTDNWDGTNPTIPSPGSCTPVHGTCQGSSANGNYDGEAPANGWTAPNNATLVEGGWEAGASLCLTLDEQTSSGFPDYNIDQPPPPTPLPDPITPPWVPPTNPTEPPSHGGTPPKLPVIYDLEPTFSWGNCAPGVYSFETSTGAQGSFQGWMPQGPQYVPQRYGVFDWAPPDPTNPFGGPMPSSPVYGNAIGVERLNPPGWDPFVANPAGNIGGDYWRFSRDSNYAGAWWLGSADYRSDWNQLPEITGTTRRPEAYVGAMVSPYCFLGPNSPRYLTFRIGGSRSIRERVELLVYAGNNEIYYGPFQSQTNATYWYGTNEYGHDTAQVLSQQQQFPGNAPDPWTTTVRAAINADPTDTRADDKRDYMSRTVVFDMFDLANSYDGWGEYGHWIFVRVIDDTNANGHINVDRFELTDTLPEGTVWDKSCGYVFVNNHLQYQCSPWDAPIGSVLKQQPIWGTTDVHAHLAANVGFNGHFYWGDVSDPLGVDQTTGVYNCNRALSPIHVNGSSSPLVRGLASNCEEGTPGSGNVGGNVTNTTHNGICPDASGFSTHSECTADVALVATISYTVIHLVCDPLAAVPWIGGALYLACYGSVLGMSVTLSAEPVLSGDTRHGGERMSSGQIAVGQWLLGPGFTPVLQAILQSLDGEEAPDLEGGMTIGGAVTQLDADTPPDHDHHREASHSGFGLGATHQRYQWEMLLRAWQGGLRLMVVDIENGRPLQQAVDGNDTYNDWVAIQDQVEAVWRLTSDGVTASPAGRVYAQGVLFPFAEIALSPGMTPGCPTNCNKGGARDVIRRNKMALILGTEVDELGKPRNPAEATSYTAANSAWISDLLRVGVRKLTPVHSSDNPLGGTGLFNGIYAAGNQWFNNTQMTGAADGFGITNDFSGTGLKDVGASQWPPGMKEDMAWVSQGVIPGTVIYTLGMFGFPFSVLTIGNWHISKTWQTEGDLFTVGYHDVDPSIPSEDWIGGGITFRYGMDSAHQQLQAFSSGTGWCPLGKVPAMVKRAHNGRSALADAPCDGNGFDSTSLNPLNLGVFDDMSWLMGGDLSFSRCNLKGTVQPANAGTLGTELDQKYASADFHRNAVGLREAGADFITRMMENGMLIDMDHFSQKARLEVYALTQSWANGLGDGYPTTSIHSELRKYERGGPVPFELRDSLGWTSEISRSNSEIQHVASLGGTIAPHINAVLFDPSVSDEFVPTGVANDCDFSSKSWALRYLTDVNLTGGKGVTPSTDMNGTPGRISSRYGWANGQGGACHTNSVGNLDHTDYLQHQLAGWPRDFTNDSNQGTGVNCAYNTVGYPTDDVDPRNPGLMNLSPTQSQRTNNAVHRLRFDDDPAPFPLPSWADGCPSTNMVNAQLKEYSGVWYDSYDDVSLIPNKSATKNWTSVVNRPSLKTITARAGTNNGLPYFREDAAPRAAIDETVAYNDKGLMTISTTDNWRKMSQMAPIKEWRHSSKSDGWDVNVDGMAHIGMLPDFLQDVHNVGVTWEQFGPMFNAAEDYIAMWEKTCELARLHNGGTPVASCQ